MSEKVCEICEIIADPSSEVVLFENAHWLTIVSNEQSYLCRALFLLKRHADGLSELRRDEVLSWWHAVLRYEMRVRDVFGAAVFNWEHLTNHAFQEVPYNPHSHWHVRPRYDHPVEFGGTTFEDPTFGNPIDRDRKMPVKRRMQISIAQLLNP